MSLLSEKAVEVVVLENDHIIQDLRHLATDISVLVPDPRNSRKHDKRNLNAIASSLREFGQRSPLVVNKKNNYVLKGNGTLEAAKLLGWKTLSVVWVEDDKLTASKYGIVDNRTAELASWDYEKTGDLLNELNEPNPQSMFDFWSEEEQLPLLRAMYTPGAQTDEEFDPKLLRGRAIQQLSAANRIVIDQAITFLKENWERALTEGGALEIICQHFVTTFKGVPVAAGESEAKP